METSDYVTIMFGKPLDQKNIYTRDVNEYTLNDQIIRNPILKPGNTAYGDAFLFTTVVKSDYMRYRTILVSLAILL